MNIKEFAEKSGFEIINTGDESIELKKVFCCDLLSIAMSKNPANSVWVTVMGNLNAIAVCVLTEGGCIVLAEGINLDEAGLSKAKQQNVTVFKTDLPVFDAALKAHKLIENA